MYENKQSSTGCDEAVVSSITHLDLIVREVRNCDCLHQSCDVCQNKHNSGNSQPLTDAGRLLHSICGPPEHDIGQCMVKAKISMRHEVQCDWNLQHQRQLLKDALKGKSRSG